MLERGKLDESRTLSRRRQARVREDLPARRRLRHARGRARRGRRSKRYREHGDFTVKGSPPRLAATSASALDIVVHSLANGPEVKKPLLETSRNGLPGGGRRLRLLDHLDGAAPRAADAPGGGTVSLTYMASERVVPGYGGGMSSAKAALESDTRTLAFEAGRKWGHRVNMISAGPYASRAASAIGFIEEMVDYCSKLAAPRGAHRARGRRTRGLPVQPAGVGHHRHHHLRRQGLPRDGPPSPRE